MTASDPYADLYCKLTAIQTDPTRWQVAYNGRILGDDRGYSSEAETLAEIENRIDKDVSDAIRYDRPVLLSK